MLIIYRTIIIVYFLATIAMVYKNKNNKANFILSIIVIIILALISGLRNNIGDTYFYKHSYELITNGQITNVYEPGFLIFLQFLNNISKDPQLMIFVTGVITTSLNIWILRKYGSLFELEVFMYIAAGYYIVTMNGIRQALVAAIMFACTGLIIKGKFLPYVIITLFMYTFHSSVLIMIPVYFIVRNESWSNKIKKIIVVSIIGLLCFQPLIGIVFDNLEGTKYESYQEEISTDSEGGANPMRLIISIVPLVLAYILRDKLKEEWPESNIFINMSIINAIIMSFSLYNWIFARFTFYFELYTIVLLPYCIKIISDRKTRDFIYYCFIICYFVFMYLDQNISQGIIYGSDFIR